MTQQNPGSRVFARMLFALDTGDYDSTFSLSESRRWPSGVPETAPN
jgi:hypothetical protein